MIVSAEWQTHYFYRGGASADTDELFSACNYFINIIKSICRWVFQRWGVRTRMSASRRIVVVHSLRHFYCLGEK